MRHKVKRRLFGEEIIERDSTILRFGSSSKEKHTNLTRKIFGALIIALAILAVVFTTYAGASYAYRMLVWQNSIFALKELYIKCNGEVLTPNHIREYGKLNNVDNIFAVNLANLKKLLIASPRVMDVEISRTLPDTISIVVWERVPIARIDMGGYYIAIDKEGVVIGPASATTVLPIIQANVQPGITPGTSMADSPIMNAIEILELCDSTPLGQIIRISSLDVRKKEEVDLTLVEGTKVKIAWQNMTKHFPVSRTNLQDKLMKLAENLRSAQERRKKIVSIDMRLDNNFPAIEVDY